MPSIRMARTALGVAALAITMAACGSQEDRLAQNGIVSAPLESNAEVLADGLVVPHAAAVISENEFLFTERFIGLSHYVDGEVTRIEGTPGLGTVTAGFTNVGGLMDVSLHPDFDSNGLVYLSFLNEELTMSVARFNFSDRAIADLEIIFESVDGSFGSSIAWQDSDHFFVTQGTLDLTPPQDVGHGEGKIHRLRADGSTPSDNPIFDGQDGPGTVWSLGHRNNQGLFMDGDTLYATEHGDQDGDELNVIVAGGNYGFPNVTSGSIEGVAPAVDDETLAAMIEPAVTWPSFTIAPTGVTRLRNSSFPDLDGRFVFGGLVSQQLVAVDIDTGETAVLLEDVGRIRDVDQLPSGDILMTVESPNNAPINGELIRLSPS